MPTPGSEPKFTGWSPYPDRRPDSARSIPLIRDRTFGEYDVVVLPQVTIAGMPQ